MNIKISLKIIKKHLNGEIDWNISHFILEIPDMIKDVTLFDTPGVPDSSNPELWRKTAYLISRDAHVVCSCSQARMEEDFPGLMCLWDMVGIFEKIPPHFMFLFNNTNIFDQRYDRTHIRVGENEMKVEEACRNLIIKRMEYNKESNSVLFPSIIGNTRYSWFNLLTENFHWMKYFQNDSIENEIQYRFVNEIKEMKKIQVHKIVFNMIQVAQRLIIQHEKKERYNENSRSVF